MNRERESGSATGESYQRTYAAIALPVPVRRLFTYEVPAGLGEAARPGCRARVPFGRRHLTGIIVSLGGAADLEPGRIRAVEALPDAGPLIGPGLLETLEWAARYYVAAPGTVLAMALPPGAGDPPRTRAWYTAAAPEEEALAALARAPRQREVLLHLARSGSAVPAEALRDELGDVAAPLKALVEKGLVAVERRRAEARPALPQAARPATRHRLTPEQEEAARRVAGASKAGAYSSFLLLGPTGSGKTEVYLTAIDGVLGGGGSAIYLVPEISLTPLLARRCRERFGAEFALLHSSLSGVERRSEWERIREGRARVVLGPRSALMAPVRDLRLVVVDEEQDSSFKQESEPRYNARDLAMVRGQKEGAAVLLGSATPSLESYRLVDRGRVELLSLSTRIRERPMAEVRVVDMRAEEEATGGDDPISRPLLDEIRGALERKEQAIIFLNRRGWAPTVLCRKCGESLQCRRCSISLTWHRRDELLLCHYCGYRRGMPRRCPACHGEKLLLAGAGTERLEKDVAAIFPEARVARLDRDVARGRQAPGRILSEFEEGRHDILVGTQLVAKGHDFPNVTVVGVVGADVALGFPDFRAAERTFQILTQVAGRAGRGERPGRVIVQAWRPDHYAIACAARQDYQAFYDLESRYRRLMGYPPFTALACVTASAGTAGTAQQRARRMADALRRAGGGQIRLTGPAPAPLSRLKGKHRFQIIVRVAGRRRLSDLLHQALESLEQDGASSRGLTIDVDPASLL